MRLRCVLLVGALLFSGCGGSSTSASTPGPTILLDSTFTLIAVQHNCYNESITREFAGTANKRITITGQSSGLTIGLILYAPDYATQLLGDAGSTTADPSGTAKLSASGVNNATLNLTLKETGTYHLDTCELNGLGGSVHVVVTQNN